MARTICFSSADHFRQSRSDAECRSGISDFLLCPSFMYSRRSTVDSAMTQFSLNSENSIPPGEASGGGQGVGNRPAENSPREQLPAVSAQ
jgi:hypothetical protein